MAITTVVFEKALNVSGVSAKVGGDSSGRMLQLVRRRGSSGSRGCRPPVCGVNSNTLLAWACGWPQMETDAERIGQVGGRVVVILRVCCSC